MESYKKIQQLQGFSKYLLCIYDTITFHSLKQLYDDRRISVSTTKIIISIFSDLKSNIYKVSQTILFNNFGVLFSDLIKLLHSHLLSINRIFSFTVRENLATICTLEPLLWKANQQTITSQHTTIVKEI